ncbi:uncharacterized protein DUF3313 [Prosthecobacter fusiformis]|uniref:Uncharacterized protein DUF3313 n=1 Tax=Prosthecobacter fusiformis TaxID=48464 RepID=A0A4R7SQM6_9BACT|nr:DUF3313 family protein [Prosthecobacter fusiformis]TDU81562.1 uncharacterized protein DUF3313 [Prosthecobacter fusiformis]
MIYRLFLCLLLLPWLISCSSLQRLAKAGAAKPSPFLAHAGELKKTQAKHDPFLRVWRNSSRKVWEEAEKKKNLYIAPVSLEHLRPMTKPLSRVEVREKTRQKEAREMGEYAREQFAKAFRASANPHYQIVDAPAKDALNLELAIIEFNPNAISAGLTRRAINILAVPGAESLVGRPLKGNIAIEGRVWDPHQKESLYEFADAEHNRSALILSIHDYNPYSAARKIIREWASQFEQITRTPAGGRVKDSPAFTIWLW